MIVWSWLNSMDLEMDSPFQPKWNPPCIVIYLWLNSVVGNLSLTVHHYFCAKVLKYWFVMPHPYRLNGSVCHGFLLEHWYFFFWKKPIVFVPNGISSFHKQGWRVRLWGSILYVCVSFVWLFAYKIKTIFWYKDAGAIWTSKCTLVSVRWSCFAVFSVCWLLGDGIFKVNN